MVPAARRDVQPVPRPEDGLEARGARIVGEPLEVGRLGARVGALPREAASPPHRARAPAGCARPTQGPTRCTRGGGDCWRGCVWRVWRAPRRRRRSRCPARRRRRRPPPLGRATLSARRGRGRPACSRPPAAGRFQETSCGGRSDRRGKGGGVCVCVFGGGGGASEAVGLRAGAESLGEHVVVRVEVERRHRPLRPEPRVGMPATAPGGGQRRVTASSCVAALLACARRTEPPPAVQSSGTRKSRRSRGICSKSGCCAR